MAWLAAGDCPDICRVANQRLFSEILLPVIVLSLVMTAHVMRMVRSSVIEVMASDYVQMATLKGCPIGRWCSAMRCQMRCCQQSMLLP